MFYSFACFAVRLLLRIFALCRVEGLENIPPTGPLVVVSNHIGFVDPPVLGAVLPRRIVFMAKEESFRWPFLGWVVRLYGAFPVRRGQADLQAIRNAVAVVERGGALGIFPEGTRSKTGKLIDAHPGVSLIALTSSAPVLPVAITGTNRVRSPLSLLARPAITISVGKPFTLARGRAGKGKLEAATRAIMGRVAVLLPEERRGLYADAVEESIESPLVQVYQAK